MLYALSSSSFDILNWILLLACLLRQLVIVRFCQRLLSLLFLLKAADSEHIAIEPARNCIPSAATSREFYWVQLIIDMAERKLGVEFFSKTSKSIQTSGSPFALN